jgi:hypothetical protein
VLRRIFGPERDKVTGEWRKLHSGELHNLYSSTSIIRQLKSDRIDQERQVARMGRDRKVYRVLMGKPLGRGPLGHGRVGSKGILGRVAGRGGVDSPGTR